MRYRDLLKAEPGTKLLVAGRPFVADQVINYKCSTASWLNLVDQYNYAGERALELTDNQIRVWKQVLDLPGANPQLDFVQYDGRRFELDEGRVRAKTITRSVGGEIKERSVTSIYVDEKGSYLSIEVLGDKTFVWYSDQLVSSRNIKQRSYEY